MQFCNKDFDCNSSCFGSIFAALYLMILFQEISLNIEYFLANKKSGRKMHGGEGEVKSFFLNTTKGWKGLSR